MKHALGGWKRDLASPELALVDALVPWAKPDSGRGFLGRWKWCARCSGRGYTAKPNGWQACSDCYAGRLKVGTKERGGTSLARVSDQLCLPDLSRCAPRPPFAQALWLVQTQQERSRIKDHLRFDRTAIVSWGSFMSERSRCNRAGPVTSLNRPCGTALFTRR